MTRPLTLSPAALSLGIGALALAWLVADTMRFERARDAQAGLAGVEAARPVAQPWRRIDESATTAVVTQSLFAPSRSATFASVGGANASVGGLTLRGLAADGARGIALFEDEGGEIVRLARGQRHGGVRVIDIDAGGVVVDTGGRTRRLGLAADSEDGSSGEPVAVAASPSYDMASRPAQPPCGGIDRTGE